MAVESLKAFKADLHIHTCLSPCGDWKMSPKQIVQKSIDKKLDIIAVCDHNTAENAEAVARWGGKQGLVVFPGLEICSREEVHILSIFEEVQQASSMQALVYDHLPGSNKAGFFGNQVIADENDMVIGENTRLLINATRLGIYEIVAQVHLLEGLCIASHILRPAYGIIRQLGFIPPDLQLDGLELSSHKLLTKVKDKGFDDRDLPYVSFSDAHYLQDIGRTWTNFILAEPTLAEIRMALKEKQGRSISF
jgi:predicted metal-dependent phosphoesterase TrpH